MAKDFETQINMTAPPTKDNHVMRKQDMSKLDFIKAATILTNLIEFYDPASGYHIGDVGNGDLGAFLHRLYLYGTTVPGGKTLEAYGDGLISGDLSVGGDVTAGAGTPAKLSDLKGVQVNRMTGAILTRVIGGSTQVAKSLFDPATVFVAGKTIITDITGTLGVYIQDISAAAIEVMTTTISPAGSHEPANLGNVPTQADLPGTISAAEGLGWQTPSLGDYAVQLDTPTEWYITAIDGSGNITWGNPRPLNMGDYQMQTDSSMAGKILIGGSVPGTWGTPITMQDIGNWMYPVGSIYMSVNNTDPSTLFGGTWVAWGQGRVPVGCGQGAGLTNRPTPEATDGAETNSLTAAQVPAHSHPIGGNTGNPSATSIGAASMAVNGYGGTGGTQAGISRTTTATVMTGTIALPDHTHTIGTHTHTLPANTGNSTGTGAAHNNMQPFITCYMWKRTA